MRPNNIHAPLAPAKGRPRPSASALAAAVVLLLIAQPARAQDATPAPTTAPAQTSPRLVAPETVAPPSPATPAPTSTAEPSTPVTGASTPADAAATDGAAAGPDTEAAPSAVVPQPVGSDVAGSPQPAEAPSDDAVGEATLPHDLSPWGMFMAADYVVKSVMVGLAFASLVTWTIWLAKALELWAARTRASRALRCLERASSLPEAVTPRKGLRWPKRGPVAALASAAAIEIERSDGLDAEGVKERAAVALQRIEARAGRTMARGTGLLATIGSTAPFVGLFGTVWGIMNAFIGISRSNTTNLAVVAPGIAEALLATAIGLVAAIPAVIIYNVFARSIAGYRAVLGDASAEILRHLSRDLDRRAERAAPPARALQAAE